MPGDSNNKDDIYLLDNLTGCLTRVSVGEDGAQADGNSHEATISQDGRYVAFRSAATNLVSSDGNGTFDIFLRDLQAGTTTRISEASGGGDANGTSYVPQISLDGAFVVFATAATDIVASDTNGLIDIIRYEISSGTATRVNLTAGGAELTVADSVDPTVSPNGNFVAFSSADTALPGANGQRQIYIRNISGSTTVLVSAQDGTTTAGNDHSQCPIVGGTEAAPLVSFLSTATDLVTGDNNASYDVFVRDLASDATTRVSVDSGGTEANGHSAFNSIDENGNVAFTSLATNLDGDDSDTTPDIYFYEASGGTVSLISRADGAAGTKGNQDTDMVALHYDGTSCAMRSVSNNLDATDTTIDDDIFLRDLGADTTNHASNAFPSTPNYLYAADQINGTIFIYSINNDGTLTAAGSQTGVTSVTQLAAQVVGDFLFVTGGGISASWSINAATGALSFVDNGVSSTFNHSLGDPSGRWVHALSTTDVVAGARLDESGNLVETLPAQADTGSDPSDSAYHPSGCFLYVSNETDNTVSIFTVSESGVLTEISTPVATSSQPVAIAMHPEGTALYVGCNAGGTGVVQAFSIDGSTGLLTSLGTAAMVSGGVTDVAIDPRGSNVYGINGVDEITHFTVDAGLTLTQDTEYDVDGTNNCAPSKCL